MARSLQIVTYELYTLEESGWILHSRYPSADRQEALDEAKGIEVNLQLATKLVRETFQPDTDSYEEAVVRISPNLVEFKKKLSQRRKNRAYGGGNARSVENSVEDSASPASTNKQLSSGRLITGIIMMTFGAIVIAGGVTAISSLLLRTQIMQQHVSARDLPQILFVIFLVVFLLAALPLINRYIPQFSSSPSSSSGNFTSSSSQRKPKPEPEEKPKEDKKKQEEEEPPALFQDDPGLIEQEPEPEVAEEPEEEPEPEPESEPEPEPEEEEEEADAEVDEDEETSSKDVPDKQRMAMMRFLTGTITILKDVCPQLNTYNKFGLNLIMAGACASLGQRASLSSEQINILTEESITILGGKASMAANFCKKLESYLTDPQYAKMYIQGQAAFEAYADESGAPFQDIGNAMRAWNKPSSRVTGAKIVTIMFTDIVSSTLITYKRGDQKAQNYIRRHNAIVRTALAEHDGEEIKHTGDGIMASFNNPSNAIYAAVDIQKAIRHHNTEFPDDVFQLRIGMNTGEPIREDNDLFGSSVQLAARICGEAGPGHIYISNVVKELVAENNYPLRQLQPRVLKGIKEAQIFHDVDLDKFPAKPQTPENSDEDMDPDMDPDLDASAGAAPLQPESAEASAPLTSDQVLNAAQQVAQSSDLKTQEASTIIKQKQ